MEAGQWARRGPPPPKENELSVLPLGSGQHVGKSCLLVTLGGKRVLLDCGVHPGRNDDSRYPDFSLLGPAADLTAALDVVVISHFHLDHIGALPYLTETLGYHGPVVMTHPTKAIAPMLLRDYRKVSTGRKRKTGDTAAEAMPIHTDAQVAECLARATGVGLHETVNVGGVELTAYYAGHVLGAAMFHLRVGDQSVLYTGDFSTVADHHLRAAWVPRLHPTLLITEGTYATAPRTWKRGREHELLEGIRQTVSSGGKVLIPVFAVGRAQELCLLLNTFWEQTGLGGKVPILFAAGMAEQATHYYKLFSQWTKTDLQQATDTASGGNVFDFPHIDVFKREEHWARVTAKDADNPMVLFATPAMLSGGLALDVFKEWADDKRNLLVMTGYCAQGTVGHAVVMGKRDAVPLGDGQTINVKCAVRNISFSAHADADGLIGLIQQCGPPRHVLLVHGEASKLRAFRRRVATELQLPCAAPPNGTVVTIDCSRSAEVGDAAAAPTAFGQRTRPRGGRPQASGVPARIDLGDSGEAATVPASRTAASCDLRWVLDVTPPAPAVQEAAAVGSKRRRGGQDDSNTAATVMAEIIDVFRNKIYCGYTQLGGATSRTLTSDGGGVLISVAADGKGLTIRWRAYEDGRLAGAIVGALREELAPRMSQPPEVGAAFGCC